MEEIYKTRVEELTYKIAINFGTNEIPVEFTIHDQLRNINVHGLQITRDYDVLLLITCWPFRRVWYNTNTRELEKRTSPWKEHLDNTFSDSVIEEILKCVLTSK